MDSTEQKVSQDAVRAAKARFEGILEIAEDAIISADASQQIVLFNQGAEGEFGYAQDEVVGKPLDLLLPQRFAHAHREHIEMFGKSPHLNAQNQEVAIIAERNRMARDLHRRTFRAPIESR